MNPFKTVKIEYYEEAYTVPSTGEEDRRRIKVVTTTEHWMGSSKDPVISTVYEYL